MPCQYLEVFERFPKIYCLLTYMAKNFEVVEFRYLSNAEDYDVNYSCEAVLPCETDVWSRIYEYPYVFNILKKYGTTESLIHNSSWGFEGCHVTFKNILDSLYKNVIHSDIRRSSLPKTMVYDVTQQMDNSYLNHFDFVLNISTIEEIQCSTDVIISNLLEQVKVGGYLIITFDHDADTCHTCGNGSINLNLVENYLNTSIKEPVSGEILTGANSKLSGGRYPCLSCGVILLRKTSHVVVTHVPSPVPDVIPAPSLSEVTENPSLTEVTEDPSLTEVTEDPSLTEVTEDPSLT